MPTGGSGTGDKSSGAVRMGRAFVELFGDDTKLAKALTAAKKKVQDFGTSIAKTGAVAGAAGSLLLAPLTRLFTSSITRTAGIQNMADKLKVPIEQLSRLQHAADVAGVSLDEVLDDPRRFRDLIQDAPAIDSATGRKAVEVQRAFARATLDVKLALLGLLDTILPAVRWVGAFVRQNAAALAVVAAVGAGLVAAGAAITVFGLALSGIATVLGIVVPALTAMVGLLLTPGGLLTAGIIAVSVELFDLKKGFVELLDTAKRTMGGIADALSAGDLALAAEVGMAGITLEWTKAVKFWTERWVEFKNVVVDGWRQIGDVAREIAGNGFWGGIATGLLTGKRGGAPEQLDPERDAKAKAFRDKQLRDAEEALAKAKAALDAAIGKAGEAADRKRFEDEMKRRGKDLAGLGGGGIAAVKGAFATPAGALQFGAGDKANAIQVKIANALGENLPPIKQGIMDLNRLMRHQ